MCALSAIDWNQGWRSVDSTRFPSMWAWYDPRTRLYMGVEFVVVSRLSSERIFSGYSGFPLTLSWLTNYKVIREMAIKRKYF